MMACYIVTIETQSEATRERVRECLKTYSGYCPIHENCWAVLSETTAAEIRNKVGEVIEAGDRLFVIRSGTEAAWRNAYGEKNSEWLKKHL